MTANWDEIKRLAADFQRAQLADSSQKLSERNCIEIVKKLQELSLVEVLYTNDGKEYLTPKELVKEISEEILVHGRIEMTSIASNLNVDLSYIEKYIQDVVSHCGDKEVQIISGECITSQYIADMVEEINDQLHQEGSISMINLTKKYELPPPFLEEIINDCLGSAINGVFEENFLYTCAYMDRFKSKIRGTFSGITQPVIISKLLKKIGLSHTSLFYRFLNDMVACGRLAGSISGNEQDKAQFVPEIYTKSQEHWVDMFYNQNLYIEYDALMRLGIQDGKSFLKKKFKKQNIISLNTCCISPRLVDRLEAEIDASSGWYDCANDLPSVLSDEDLNQVLLLCCKSRPQLRIFCNTMVCNDSLLQSLAEEFKPIMAKKADEDSKTTTPLLFIEGEKQRAQGINDGSLAHEERRDARKKKMIDSSAGKTGGGLQGREVKIKATKKKYNRREESVNESNEPTSRSSAKYLPFLGQEDIEKYLEKVHSLQNAPEDLISAIAAEMEHPLQLIYQDIARSVFMQSRGIGSGMQRKQTFAERQDRIVTIWNNMCLFEKGTKLLEEASQALVFKNLLKMLGNEVANEIFSMIQEEKMVGDAQSVSNPEQRLKMLAKLDNIPEKENLGRLHMSLSKSDLETWHSAFDDCCLHLQIMLRKADKKREKQLMIAHRQQLIEQLEASSDQLAQTLHLAATIIFQTVTGCMILVPSRCVPQLISFLQTYLPADEHGLLTLSLELVTMSIKNPDDVDKDKLEQLVPRVRELAVTCRKRSSQSS